MYRCPNCGGDMRFSPEKQKIVCDFCGSEFNVDEFDDAKEVNASEHAEAAPSGDGEYYEATVFTCPMCGGELISTSAEAATFCSFCGASVILESRISNEKKPDMIIPFKISREQCASAYKKQVAKALFVPSRLKSDNEISKFRSIYMPYRVYSYDYDAKLNVRGSISNRRGDYIYTEHYSIMSDLQMEYDGIAYDASSSFSDNLSAAVAPFDLKEADDFKRAYMTGHYADTSDVDADVYEPDAEGIVREHAADIISADKIYSSHGASRSDVIAGFKPALKSEKLGFFPVWFLSSRNAAGDRVSYAAVNGQTGRVAADMPVSFLKYLFGSILLAIPFFLLLSFAANITLTPRVMLIIAMILGLIGVLILNSQLNRVYTRENNLDDKGWQALRGRTMNKTKKIKTPAGEVKISVKEIVSGLGAGTSFFIFILGAHALLSLPLVYFVLIVIAAVVFIFCRALIRDNSKKRPKRLIFPAPFKDKIYKLVKPLAGMLVSLIAVIVNPFEDTIYYACALVSLFLIVWSFYDIIRTHNRLTERPLPQLGKRGGDENA